MKNYRKKFFDFFASLGLGNELELVMMQWQCVSAIVTLSAAHRQQPAHYSHRSPPNILYNLAGTPHH